MNWPVLIGIVAYLVLVVALLVFMQGAKHARWED